MKFVLASIQPQWCELIVSGRKTYEIRKNAIPVGCKVYIYQTKKSWTFSIYPELANNKGMVIGEFICDKIIETSLNDFHDYDIDDDVVACSCVKRDEIFNYGKGKKLYFWHISDLRIYQDAKRIDEYARSCGHNPNCVGCFWRYAEFDGDVLCYEKCCAPIEYCLPVKTAPQSWFYVEEFHEKRFDERDMKRWLI